MKICESTFFQARLNSYDVVAAAGESSFSAGFRALEKYNCSIPCLKNLDFPEFLRSKVQGHGPDLKNSMLRVIDLLPIKNVLILININK